MKARSSEEVGSLTYQLSRTDGYPCVIFTTSTSTSSVSIISVTNTARPGKVSSRSIWSTSSTRDSQVWGHFEPHTLIKVNLRRLLQYLYIYSYIKLKT